MNTHEITLTHEQIDSCYSKLIDIISTQLNLDSKTDLLRVDTGLLYVIVMSKRFLAKERKNLDFNQIVVELISIIDQIATNSFKKGANNCHYLPSVMLTQVESELKKPEDVVSDAFHMIEKILGEKEYFHEDAAIRAAQKANLVRDLVNCGDNVGEWVRAIMVVITYVVTRSNPSPEAIASFSADFIDMLLTLKGDDFKQQHAKALVQKLCKDQPVEMTEHILDGMINALTPEILQELIMKAGFGMMSKH